MMVYSFQTNDIQKVVNEGCHLLIEQLKADGYFTQEQFDTIEKTYVVAVYEKGFFGKFFDKLWEMKDGTLSYRILKTR